MALAWARQLMRAVTASRAHAAAAHTGRIGLAVTYARCAPLHSSLIHTQRWFASAVAASDPVAAASAASAASSAAPSSAPSSLSTVQSQLSACVKSQQPTEAERIIRQFEVAGGRLNVAMLAQWISCHAKAGDWEGAERVWARVRELQLKPDNHSYAALMQVYTQAGGDQLSKIDSLLAEMQREKVDLSLVDYDRLIRFAHYCKLPGEVRRWSAASLFVRLVGSAHHPHSTAAEARGESRHAAASSSHTDTDFAAVRSQLQAALVEGDSAAASQIISAFEQRGGHCDISMLNMWIGCHQKARDWQGAERAWARISELGLKPDNVSYRTLIQVYTNAGGEQLAKIDPLLAEMQQSGVRFSAKDYANLIKSAFRCRLPAEVRRWTQLARAAVLFDSLDETSRVIASLPANRVDSAAPVSTDASSAFSSSTAAADSAAVKSQLRVALSAEDAQTAQQIISEFEERGRRPDVMMINQWIGCHQKARDWQGAERVWTRFSELSLKPDNMSYRTLIQVYTNAGGDQLAKIAPLLTQMHQCGVQLAAKDYQSLIKCAHHCKLPAEVRRWCASARAAGLFDSMDEISRTIASLSVNRVDSAVPSSSAAASSPAASSFDAASLSFLATADVASVHSQLKAALTEGHSAAASQLISAFEQRGGHCDIAMLTQWISSHDKAGDWQGAERVWARIDELQLQPSHVSYRTLINVYTRAGGEQLAKIDPLLAEMQQSGVQLSVKDYEQLIKCAHRCKWPAEVCRWGASARAAGVFDSLDDASRFIASLPVNRVDSAAPVSTDASSASSSSAAAAAFVTAKSQLSTALSAEDPQTAQRVISAFEERGGRPDVMMLNQWISCHKKSGDWQGAERGWARIRELNLKPSNVSYRTLIQVYTNAGGEQLAKIDPLLAEMQQSGVRFSAKDYQSLIKCAHHCNLPAEVGRWCVSARAAGLFASPDAASRGIAAGLPSRMDSASASNEAPSSAASAVDAPATVASSFSSAAALDRAAVKSQLRTALVDPAASTEPQRRSYHCAPYDARSLCARDLGSAVSAVSPLAPTLSRLSVLRRSLSSCACRLSHAATAPLSPLVGRSLSSSSFDAASASVHPLGAAASIKAQLRICLGTGDSAGAERVIKQFELEGGQCDVVLLNMQIGCHERAADWEGAERVWARLPELRIKPNGVSFASLIQVYMRASSSGQLSKIDALLHSMKEARVHFAARDYEKLIKTAQHCQLSSQVRRWTDHARKSGLFDRLDEPSRRIAVAAALDHSDPTSGGSLRRWRSMTDAEKLQSSLVLPSLLADLASEGKTRVIDSVLLDCKRVGLALDIHALDAWIGGFQNRGDWAGAESVWKRFGEFGVRPQSFSYGALIQVYTQAGKEQLAKIDELLIEMQRAGVSFTVSDYARLIETAHRRHLPTDSEVRRWIALARADGLFDQLDPSAQRIDAALPAQTTPAPTRQRR